MKKLLALLAIAAACLLGQDSYAQNVEGQIIASQFGAYQVPGIATGSLQFEPASCQVIGGGKNFNAFSVGVPVKIVDSNPLLNEIDTPSSVQINACTISMATSHIHATPFYVTSGTGGLQEALINGLSKAGGANTVILNADWYAQVLPGNPATVIAAVKGSTTLGLVDVTTTPYTSYTWNGSAYAANGTGGANTPATSNLLKGNGAANGVIPAVPGTDFLVPGALPGTTTATTQTTGDNTTKVATDAFVLGNSATASIPNTVALLKGAGVAGSAAAATVGTDYFGPQTATAAYQTPLSTGAGTTFAPGGVPVSFGTAQTQYIQQQVTNSNYTTLNINSLNDEIWVEGFTGGPYTGIGQTQVAWVTATNYPLCQNVSYSGGNYVAITYPNSSVTPTSNVTVWWPKATSDATTQADCAFASAAGKAAATSKQQTLRAGSGSWNMTGWIEPGGLYSVNIKSCGIFCGTWNFTGTAAVPMVQRATGGAFTFLDVSDAYWEPNQVASSIFDLGALNQSHFDNMQWDNPAPLGTGNSGNFFARFGESGGDGFQVYPNNITMGTSPTNHNTATITANLTGTTLTSFTLVNGGSGYLPAAANNILYLQINGYKGGTSFQPCTVMPTWSGNPFTVVSGVITAVAAPTSGGTGCSGTIDVAAYSYFPVQWGIYNNASDSTLKDITIYASSPYGAGIYDNGGDTHHIHIHPSFITNGIATICANDTYESTELDNVYNQGFQFNQPFAGTGCAVSGTHSYGATAKGNAVYYFASALAQVTIGTSASLSGGTTAADWQEFVTQSGTIAATSDWATKAPSGLVVTGNDLSAGEAMGDWQPIINATTANIGTLNATTFNPSSIGSVSITANTLGTATSGTNYSSGNITLSGSYYNSTAHLSNWVITNQIGAGTNPVTALNFACSTGSTGQCQANFSNSVLGAQIIKTTGYTVAALPSASTSGAGAQVTVTDATTFTPGTCTGGGSDYMIAISNGSTWSCH